MFSRAMRYFDEVARYGSIRRASEKLNIAPSAVDRQILQLERELGTLLFERMPQGLRLTAAGETLVGTVRRWRRELNHVRAQIDDLHGLRRGEISTVIVEGAISFFAPALARFQADYPGISHTVQVLGSGTCVDRVLGGEAEIGLVFNPPESHALRVEQFVIYQLGAIVPTTHPLAARSEIPFVELADHPLVIPDESMSLRKVFDAAWSKTLGGTPRYAASVSSTVLVAALVRAGVGVGLLTAIDIVTSAEEAGLVFVPISGSNISLSVLSVISASGRALSVPASLFLHHLALSMTGLDAPADPALPPGEPSASPDSKDR